MDEPYLGEIRQISFNYAPKGWTFCNGQLLPIQQNQALFSLLGTTYGGDGQNTFALPNMQSRVPVGIGQGQGLANYVLGEAAGQESVTLISTQIPAHTHTLTGTLKAGSDQDETNPKGQYPSLGSQSQYSQGTANSKLGEPFQGVTQPTGAQPHDNRQPLLAVYYVIALQGIYPSPD